MATPHAVFLAVFAAAQVMSVTPFGLMGMMNNTQGAENSRLGQMLADIKKQAQTAAQPFVTQMAMPFRVIAQNFMVMSLLAAQMVTNLANEKLKYLSDMANIPGQQNVTGNSNTPAPQSNVTAAAGNNTTSG